MARRATLFAIVLLGGLVCACSAESLAAEPRPPAEAAPEEPEPPPPAPPEPEPDEGPTNPCSAGSFERLPTGQWIWIPAECNPYEPYLGDPSPLGERS